MKRMVIFMQEIKYCPKCEGENKLDHKFCVFCGEKFPTPKQEIYCINIFTEQIGTGKKAKFIYNPNSGEKSIVHNLDFIINIYQMYNITLVPYRINKNECIEKAFLEIIFLYS